MLCFSHDSLLTGGNEEIGWQGFLPAKSGKDPLPFPLATVTTGLIWAVWHLPLFFTPGSSQAGTSFLVFAACLLSPVSGWQPFTEPVSLSSNVSLFLGSLILTIGEGIFVGKGTENPLFPRLYLDGGLQYLSLVSRDQQDKA